MNISINNIRLTLILIVTFLTGILFINLTEDILYHIFTLCFFCLVSAKIVNFDILHPYLWFSGFMCLYSISYPLLCYIGIYSTSGYRKEIMVYQLTAMFVGCLVSGANKNKKININNIKQIHIDVHLINKLLYFFIVVSILLATVFVSKTGYIGKDDVYENGGLVLNFIFKLPLVLTIIYTISVLSYISQKKSLPLKQIIGVGFTLLVLTLYSGERDFFFRFIMVNLFIFWYMGRIKAKHLILLIPLLSIIIPLSSAFKYYFTRGVVYNQELSILHSFLAGEFESSAKNLQLLVTNKDVTEGVFGYKQILLDFVSVFIKSIKSPSSWFNTTFFPWSKSQYGFSLVGEGYIIDGFMGIVVLFSIIGLIIRFFYRNAHRNIYWLSSYFYFITVTIYSFRGDLGTILSAVIKQIGFVLILLVLFQKICNKKGFHLKF
jgi:oligosaccharide repeat unit polymerase